MTNTVFPKGAEKILSGAINLQTDTIKAALVSSAYTYSVSHEFVSSLGARIGTDQELTGKSVALGTLDAADINFGPLAPGSTVKAAVVYKDTGNPSTSPVLFYLDSGPNVGLPFVTNGGALTVPWNDGDEKIAQFGLPFYPRGGEKVLSGGVDFATNNIKAVALPTSYTYSQSHEFLADAGAVVGPAVALTGKTVANGVFDADDVALGVLAAGSTLGSVLLYRETGDAATSPLLMHITDITGFPLATNGSNVTVRWSDGALKIFSAVPV